MYTTRGLLHMLNNERWEHEERASRSMRPATHINITAVNQGMCYKRWQMLQIAAETPVRILILIKVFTCLNNLSKVGYIF